jgi:hypothetical protein
MTWLVRFGYFLIAVAVLTPISGRMLDLDLHRDTHLSVSYLAAVLFLLGLLAISIGRRDRGGHSGRNGHPAG